VQLFADRAPKTVNNFVFLAQQKFFDGSIFHRVIPNFGEGDTAMIQGGDAANRNGTGDAGYKFEDENTIPLDKPGYLAMANSGPGTNGSQFFVLEGTVPHLNVSGQCPGPSSCHSVFGEVTSGIDVVRKIGAVQRGEGDRPSEDVVLVSVTIQES
jgi:cyclophilin family peptidyl-prolyl cis-trans isomerase